MYTPLFGNSPHIPLGEHPIASTHGKPPSGRNGPIHKPLIKLIYRSPLSQTLEGKKKKISREREKSTEEDALVRLPRQRTGDVRIDDPGRHVRHGLPLRQLQRPQPRCPTRGTRSNLDLVGFRVSFHFLLF